MSTDKGEEGRQRKADGIKRVMSAEDEAWQARAVGLYRAYMATRPHAFTAEGCKIYALARDLGTPHHHNAWGGLFSALARSGQIVKTGHTVKSQLPSRHANEVPVWRLAGHV